MLIKSFKTLQNKAKNSIFAKTVIMLFLMAFTASTAWALDYTARGQTYADAPTWKNCTVNINGNGSITFENRITISGTVTLNLGANTTLVALEGIELAEGNTLTINGSGTLKATGASGKSGIGSQFFGTLVVNGGNITATGGSYAAGIGGDQFSWEMGHTGNGTTVKGNNLGTISGTPWSWETWNQGGTQSMIYYNNGTYKAQWSNVQDYFVSMGYDYGNTSGVDYKTKRYSADYKYTKTGSASTFSCIGAQGWTTNPATQFFIVDDWYNAPTFSNCKKIGTATIDGATYTIYVTYKQSMPSPFGTSNYIEIYSKRESTRQQGHIDISAHFRKFEELLHGQTVTLNGKDVSLLFGGKVYQLWLFCEVCSSTGSIDYTYYRMTDDEKSNITINGGAVTAAGGTGASGIGAASNGGSPGMLALGDGVTVYGGTSSNPTGNAVTGPVDDVTTRYRYMKVEKSTGITTAINSINPSTDEPIYFNLQGQRVDHPAWGVYIRQHGKDRKKVVVREINN